MKEKNVIFLNNPKTNTDHHNGDLNVRFYLFVVVVVSFTHF